MKIKVLQYIADQIIKKMKSIPKDNIGMFEKWMSIGFMFNDYCINRNIYLKQKSYETKTKLQKTDKRQSQ